MLAWNVAALLRLPAAGSLRVAGVHPTGLVRLELSCPVARTLPPILPLTGACRPAEGTNLTEPQALDVAPLSSILPCTSYTSYTSYHSHSEDVQCCTRCWNDLLMDELHNGCASASYCMITRWLLLGGPFEARVAWCEAKLLCLSCLPAHIAC